MNSNFPSAVPEIPVSDMQLALAYYRDKLGFTVDWGDDGGGIAGISQGDCRLFLTDGTIRGYFHNQPPVVVWLNLQSREDVDALHEVWAGRGASILQAPASNAESHLHEFIATDPDGNFIRAFFYV